MPRTEYVTHKQDQFQSEGVFIIWAELGLNAVISRCAALSSQQTRGKYFHRNWSHAAARSGGDGAELIKKTAYSISHDNNSLKAVSGQVCSQFPCQFRTNCQILKLIYLEKLFIEKSASHDEGSLKYLLSGGVTLDTVILGKNKGQASARGIRRPDTTEALRIALTRRMSEHFINLAK